MEKQFLTIKEAAQYGSISRRTLHKFLNDPIHPLPHFRLGTTGRMVRVRKEELENWMENFRINSKINIDKLLNDLK